MWTHKVTVRPTAQVAVVEGVLWKAAPPVTGFRELPGTSRQLCRAAEDQGFWKQTPGWGLKAWGPLASSSGQLPSIGWLRSQEASWLSGSQRDLELPPLAPPWPWHSLASKSTEHLENGSYTMQNMSCGRQTRSSRVGGGSGMPKPEAAELPLRLLPGWYSLR